MDGVSGETNPGVPEPQIGPNRYGPRLINSYHGSGDGNGLAIADSLEDSLSQDSLNQLVDQEMRPRTPLPNDEERVEEAGLSVRRISRTSDRPSSRTSDQPISGTSGRPVSRQSSRQSSESRSRASSRSSRTVQFGNREENEILAPRSGYPNDADHDSHISNPFILTRHLQPLASAASQEASWIDSVLDAIVPQITSELKIQLQNEQEFMEEEHQKRLKNLNEHHQSEQFIIYEKNVELQERIQKLESELKIKNESFEQMQETMFADEESNHKCRVLYQWRLQCQEKRTEEKVVKILSGVRRRNILKTYFNRWSAISKSKWKSKVEKICKERATEVCIRLKDELTAEINRLKIELAKRDETIHEMENKQSRYEQGLSKALMRGVCALNMEAMSVLNNPEYQGEDQYFAENIFDPASINGTLVNIGSINKEASLKKRSVTPVTSSTNLVRQSSGNIPYPLTKPASNIFIDTVNSLQGISRKKKVQVKNSTETSGGLANRNEQSSKSVRIERHEGSKTTQSPRQTRPEGKKPWLPTSVKILNCENQKWKRMTQNYSAIKHVD